MPTTVRLARCAAKAGHSHWEPTSSTARPKWVVVGLTRLRAEPENMEAGHTVCQRGSRQQIFGDRVAHTPERSSRCVRVAGRGHRARSA
jgi:hypothetical protein